MKDFINENNISFAEGERNSTCVTLIGYAQFKRLTKKEFEDALNEEIKADGFVGVEIDRLWDYCKARNYKNYWSTTEASLQYTF